MNIGQRIKFSRNKRGRSQKWLALELGITQTSVSDWERNENLPSTENLAAVAVLLNVSFEWLATGRIPKEFNAEGLLNENDYEAIPIIPSMSPEWQSTLNGIAELPQDQREELRLFIDRLILKKTP